MHELQGDSYASKQALARLPPQLMSEFAHTTSRRPMFMRCNREGIVENLQVNQILSAYVGGKLLLDFGATPGALSYARASSGAGASENEMLPDWITQRTSRNAAAIGRKLVA